VGENLRQTWAFTRGLESMLLTAAQPA